jgi:hypothetical protein
LNQFYSSLTKNLSWYQSITLMIFVSSLFVPITIYIFSFLSLLLFDYELYFFCFISLRNNKSQNLILKIDLLEKENKELRKKNLFLLKKENIENIARSIKK